MEIVNVSIRQIAILCKPRPGMVLFQHGFRSVPQPHNLNVGRQIEWELI